MFLLLEISLLSVLTCRMGLPPFASVGFNFYRGVREGVERTVHACILSPHTLAMHFIFILIFLMIHIFWTKCSLLKLLIYLNSLGEDLQNKINFEYIWTIFFIYISITFEISFIKHKNVSLVHRSDLYGFEHVTNWNMEITNTMKDLSYIMKRNFNKFLIINSALF